MPYKRVMPIRGAGGKIRGVKPTEMRAYQGKVALCARLAGVRYIPEGPVGLYVVAYLARKPAGANSGDWDNYGKTVSDALNGIAYNDDCQVVLGLSLKLYDKARPRLEVLLRQGAPMGLEALGFEAPPWGLQSAYSPPP